uniref:UDP-galactose-4 epimerase n=1 Tax=Cyamopsis tetragonoloba TaxID=3832 RepID=A0A678P429_CYATE|nr:UDP-galactose-4 epimerase [Cyamopsis tetragonoloba]
MEDHIVEIFQSCWSPREWPNWGGSKGCPKQPHALYTTSGCWQSARNQHIWS